MCKACDKRTEEWVRIRYAADQRLCDCDLFGRWVCLTCRTEEMKLVAECTEPLGDWPSIYLPSKVKP